MTALRPTAERVRALLHYDPVTGEFRWRAKPAKRIMVGTLAGAVRQSGYRAIGIDGYYHQASRLAWLIMIGAWPKRFIDHANGDRGDNRWANLREATPQQNQRNRAPRSKFKGVSYRGGGYRVRITVDAKEIYLGRFRKADAAARAYDAAAIKHFGTFARLNFPEERGTDA